MTNAERLLIYGLMTDKLCSLGLPRQETYL